MVTGRKVEGLGQSETRNRGKRPSPIPCLWLAHSLSLPSFNPSLALYSSALSLQPWRWRKYVSLKCWHRSMKLHGARTQNVTIIFSAVKTSNLTWSLLSTSTLCQHLQGSWNLTPYPWWNGAQAQRATSQVSVGFKMKGKGDEEVMLHQCAYCYVCCCTNSTVHHC
jgi:hypothetical protein